MFLATVDKGRTLVHVSTELSARALIAVAQACRDTADYARGLVGAIDQPGTVTARIRAKRQLRLQALVALDREVLACKIAGASWGELGEALGMPAGEVERRYDPVLQRWLGNTTPDHDLVFGDHVTGLPYDVDPEGTAQALDAWYARHAEPWEQDDARPGPCMRALAAHT